MRPNEFFSLALTLAQNNTAASKRTAVSRAYYASHHLAAEVIRALGGKVGKGGEAHAIAYNTLSGCGVKDVEKLGEKIKNLHSWRIKADYRLDDQFVEGQGNVMQRMQEATDVINTLEDLCLIEPQKQQVRQGIERIQQIIGADKSKI